MATVAERQLEVLKKISGQLTEVIGQLKILASTVKPDEEPPAVTVTDVTD